MTSNVITFGIELTGSRLNSPGAIKEYLAWGRMRANYDQKVDSLYSQFKRSSPQGTFDQFRVTPEAMAARKEYNDQMYSFAAQKGIDIDESGNVLFKILDAIKEVFPLQEEIDQGVYIGLYELQRLAGTTGNVKLPVDWMKTLLESCRKTFKASHLLHSRAKIQWEHSHPGAGWVAPTAMANFMRELHLRNGGKLNLPYHGDGAKVGIEDGNIAPGLFPQEGV